MRISSVDATLEFSSVSKVSFDSWPTNLFISSKPGDIFLLPPDTDGLSHGLLRLNSFGTFILLKKDQIFNSQPIKIADFYFIISGDTAVIRSKE